MALNRVVFCLLALLPAVAVAQSPQAERFTVETYQAPPAPVEAGPGEFETSDTSPFEVLSDPPGSPSPGVESAGLQPLTVNDADDINPYAVSVQVRSRFAEDRAEALQAALVIVLARLTGELAPDRAGVGNGVAARRRQLINRAPQLVQQYRYETPPPTADGFGPRPSQLRLRAEFSPSVMQREIQLAGLPLLTGERPTTLLWPLQQTGSGWQLLGADSPLRDQWQKQADGRGFRLFTARGDLPQQLSELPLVELDEQLRSLGDSFGIGPHQPVRVVVARGVAQRWSELAGLQRRWLARDSADTAGGLTTLLDGYAEGSAAVVMAGPSVKINVANVNSVARYAALQRYFQQLEQVQTQQLGGATADSVTLNLRLRGDTALLRSALEISGTLQADSAASDAELRYRWAGN